jgi:hypothetical protein
VNISSKGKKVSHRQNMLIKGKSSAANGKHTANAMLIALPIDIAEAMG